MQLRLVRPPKGDASTIHEYRPGEFLEQVWEYDVGQHVTILAPTNWGKSTWLYKLLGATITPELPGLVLVSKPRDSTSTRWGKALDLKRISVFPPQYGFRMARMAKVRGWLFWPPHHGDSTEEIENNLAHAFRDTLFRAYRAKPDLIIMADEILDFTDMGLRTDLRVLWTRGRSSHKGLWSGSQKPVDIPTWAYSQAHHLFIGNDPDARVVKRYSEIGGVDPALITAASLSLEEHEWLYIKRSDRSIAIVTAH